MADSAQPTSYASRSSTTGRSEMLKAACRRRRPVRQRPSPRPSLRSGRAQYWHQPRPAGAQPPASRVAICVSSASQSTRPPLAQWPPRPGHHPCRRQRRPPHPRRLERHRRPLSRPPPPRPRGPDAATRRHRAPMPHHPLGPQSPVAPRRRRHLSSSRPHRAAVPCRPLVSHQARSNGLGLWHRPIGSGGGLPAHPASAHAALCRPPAYIVGRPIRPEVWEDDWDSAAPGDSGIRHMEQRWDASAAAARPFSRSRPRDSDDLPSWSSHAPWMDPS